MFELEDFIAILQGCEEYQEEHSLRRPFMSSYQIAIRFAQIFPDHPAVRELSIGGTGTGSYESLAQRIARFLSQAAQTIPNIDGGFISHENVSSFSFRNPETSENIEVSTLNSRAGHAIFRSVN